MTPVPGHPAAAPVSLEAAAPEALVPDDEGQEFQAWHYWMVDAPEAWSITTGSSDVLAAVVDDGIRFDHPDIAHQGSLTPRHSGNILPR